MLRQRLHQVKLRGGDETEHALRHRLVIQGVMNRVGQCGFTYIGAEIDIEKHGLLHLSFPVVNTDDGFGLQRANENFVHFDVKPLLTRCTRAPDLPALGRRAGIPQV